MRMFRVLALFALVSVAPAVAQETGKKVLTQADYDIWRSIQSPALSNDGQWAAYSIQPLVGEGELIVRNTKTGTEYRHTRGYTGRPPAPGMPPTPQFGGGGGGGGQGGGGGIARFTADSKYVLFMVQPSKEEVERAQNNRRGRGAARAQEQNSLAIMNLADGKVTLIPAVRSFAMAENSGKYVAYLLQAADSAGRAGAAADSGRAAPNVAANVPGGEPRPVSADSSNRSRTPRKTYGSTMVIRELATGTETRVEDVVANTFNETGSQLAYTVSSRAKPESDGVYLRAMQDGKTTTVLSGLGNYRQLEFDRKGEQIVFVSDRDEYGKEKARFTLYHASVKSPTAKAIVKPDHFGSDVVVVDRGQIGFTRDGNAVTFAIAPVLPEAVPADSLADKAIYDLWHWQDPRLQSQQENSASRDRNRTWTGIYHLASGKALQLTNDSFPSVSLSDNGRIGVMNTGVPYAIEAMWGEGGTDIYVVDAQNGTRKLIRTRARQGGQLSPGGKYVTWFEQGKWHAYTVATGKTVEITNGLPVKFDRETHDTPSEPPAWGIAGWTPNDNSVLVYDRYDVWELDPAGAREPKVVTDSYGRQNRVIFRVVDLDDDDRFIDPSQPLLLSAMDDETKASGFWTDRLNANVQPSRIVMEDRDLGNPRKAKNAEQYLLTKSTFVEFPDLWTGTRLDQLTKISDANPQQKNYRWGNVEMVSWRNMDGVPVRGLLYKPEDFDPSKKYPMVVYFYEQHTDGLHNYSTPTGRNVINAPVYVSKGYLVFMPDIYYTDGYPGPSALKTIVPGVQMLINKGFVKEDGIGIQGQSWGGYQTAYIITQSNLFKAAMAGAPVANMTSAYGGIRWESGNSRTSQYEHGQSRIGGSPWEFPERYIENSPLFFADRVKTPLFIMHNDEDGAVPWQQGIEMFIALRRLNKEVYLINYNGDAHNPRKRANQRDMDIKMQQFFDHHLTGAPMPDWMKEGIPFLNKGRDQIVAPKPTTTTTTTTSMK